ncbi:MAG TPA: L,D-transpeptidase [Gaiellaceae bacterium]|nr:L,D-transpeptidase [Gaiellaceae bacterium]
MSNRVLILPALVACAVTAAVAAPARASAGSSTPTKIETVFPAAGSLLVHSVGVRMTPNPHAKVIKVMHDFRSDFRPQVMFAVGEQTGTDGKPWYHISIPMRPNGTYGWVPAALVSLSPTKGRIVVSLGARTIDLYWGARHVWHAKVAIGAPGRETPTGSYFVAARFVPYHDPFLGVFAVETSAYSKLTEWPGGGVVGIHGTSLPQLLGQAVSHGCVRVANVTAEKLKRYAPLGTPILIKN